MVPLFLHPVTVWMELASGSSCPKMPPILRLLVLPPAFSAQVLERAPVFSQLEMTILTALAFEVQICPVMPPMSEAPLMLVMAAWFLQAETVTSSTLAERAPPIIPPTKERLEDSKEILPSAWLMQVSKEMVPDSSIPTIPPTNPARSWVKEMGP